MSDEELERLLWEQLDGTISPADCDRLQARLDRDREARACQRLIAAIASGLARIPEAEPPPGIRDAVAATTARQLRPPRRGWGASLLEYLEPRWPVRLAWACVGLALALAALLVPPALHRAPSGEVAPYYGSLGPPSPRTGWEIALPDGHGSLALVQGATALELRLEGGGNGQGARIEIRAPGLALRSITTRGPGSTSSASGPLGLSVEIDPGGQAMAVIGLPSVSGMASVRLLVGGRVLLDEELALGARVPSARPPTSGEAGGT